MIWIVTDEPLTKDELVPLVKERGYEAAHVPGGERGRGECRSDA